MVARANIRERDIEDYFIIRVSKAGGEQRKLKWINRDHAPDRVVFLNGVYFVELKRPGEKPNPGQAREHARMRKHGADVTVIDTVEGVDLFIERILL